MLTLLAIVAVLSFVWGGKLDSPALVGIGIGCAFWCGLAYSI